MVVHKSYIGNVEVEGVKNKEAREITVNYDRDKSDNDNRETNIGTIETSREANDSVLQYLAGGITGGTPGIFEGLEYREEIERAGVTEVIFDGYFDFSDEHELSKITSRLKVKEKDSVDFLNDVVDGFSFEYLESIGLITSADYEWMPYVLNSIPDYSQSMLSVLSTYVIIEQIKTVITHIGELAASMTNPFEVTAIIRAILYLIYVVGLFLSIQSLVKDTVNLIIQPVKYHACMSLKKHLEKGAAYLGYEFESPFFDEERWQKAYLMPEKLYVKKDSTDEKIFGFKNPGSTEQKGYVRGTYGDLLRACKTMLCAKIVVRGNKIILIREDKSADVPVYQLAHESDSDYYQPYYRYNTADFISNYVISFAYDVYEKNTIQEYKGTSYQVITEAPMSVNPKLKLMKRLSENQIPYALAKRKTSLTVPEKILKSFLDVFSDISNVLIGGVNALISAYNAIVDVVNGIIKALDFIGIDVNWEIPNIDPIEPIDLGSIIENRIGMMKIEYDHFTVPKIFMMDKGSQAKYNKVSETQVTAKELWHTCHYIKSFVPYPDRPFGNQSIVKSLSNIPFVYTDYQNTKNNSRIFDFEGNEQDLITLKWRPYTQSADILYKMLYLYTTNLTEKFIEPDGS